MYFFEAQSTYNFAKKNDSFHLQVNMIIFPKYDQCKEVVSCTGRYDNSQDFFQVLSEQIYLQGLSCRQKHCPSTVNQSLHLPLLPPFFSYVSLFPFS
jgi:hypothetical protein